MGDKIHPTHFQVPEMPWREKEKQAILLLQKILGAWMDDSISREHFIHIIMRLEQKNSDLVDWVMKYKGE